jgi:hypothetical protein
MLPSTSELRSVKAHWRSVQPKVKSAVGGVLLPPDGPFESLHAASSAAQLTRVKIREERIVLGSMPQGKSTLSLGIGGRAAWTAGASGSQSRAMRRCRT